jgi:hypothetical protein
LESGGEISVDPQTHRATHDADGVQRPLWDGVHRLDDGSTVIIRDGIAVPTETMVDAWSRRPQPKPTLVERWCSQLVRKSCGFDGACSSSSACLRARSLAADEAREQRGLPLAAGAHPRTATSGRCRKALVENEYPACSSLESGAGESRCRPLVAKTCGRAAQCADSQACRAARQLLGFETEERLVNDDPGMVSTSGRQCLEAMANPFFKACVDDAESQVVGGGGR